MNHSDLIIEIDDEIEGLINEINASNEKGTQDFYQSFRDVIVDSLMGPFGLSAAMFQDKDGGNITTAQNFEKGIVAERDQERYENYKKAQTEKFDRSDYERDLPSERKKIFKDQEKIYDQYTGNEIPKDGRAHRDHVVSAHEVEKSAKGHLGQAREERVATANKDDNKVWTNSSLNQSKGDKDFKEWQSAPNAKDPTKTNSEAYGIDQDAADTAYIKAKDSVNNDQDRAVLKKQGKEFLQEGAIEAGKLVLRQILGLIIKDLIEGVISDIKRIMREGFQSVKHFSEMVKNRISETIEKIKSKWKEYFKEGLSAAIGGFLSSLLTLIINSFVTTAKNVVRIIREGCASVIRALKIIISPPPGMSSSDVFFEVTKILGATIVVIIGIGIEEPLKKSIEMIPILMPFAGSIASVLTMMITGLASLLVLIAFDKLKDFFDFHNKAIVNVHRGQKVAFLKIKKTAIIIDSAYDGMAVSYEYFKEEFYKIDIEIDKLRDKTKKAREDKIESFNKMASLLDKF